MFERKTLHLQNMTSERIKTRADVSHRTVLHITSESVEPEHDRYMRLKRLQAGSSANI